MTNLICPFLSKKWEDIPSFYPIHYYIQKSCLDYSASIAVKYLDQQLTYHDLHELSGKVASYIKGVTIGKEARVGLLGNNSLLTAPSILGILKSSGTYVPISTTFPVARIQYILEDAGIGVLLCLGKSDMYFSLQSSANIIVVDVNDIVAGNSPSAEITAFDTSSSAAYVLYTSGSTGEPKGVIIEHYSLCYYLYWHCLKLREDIGHVDLPLTSSLCFAAAVTQFYTPLLLGKTLHILPEDTIRHPALLFDWYKQNKEFGLYCVPTLWEELVSFAEMQSVNNNRLTTPRCVLLSGEKTTDNLIDRSYSMWPEITIWNLYGPTEATANVAASMVTPKKAITIGEPIPGCNFYVLDEALKQVNPGTEGELFVSGPLLAREYNNKPELTQQRFLTNPFSTDLSRMYRTGDRVVLDEEGQLLFLGRIDGQIKIRGHRVEIREIETHLEKFVAISQAVVIFLETNRNVKELVAYIKFLPYKYAGIAELRQFLALHLPSHMIPARFVILDAFEKLSNGKINYKKLPLPLNKRPDLGYPLTLPANLLEKQLVQLWQNILKIEEVGVDDNFFDLGCNSLHITDASRRINQATGFNLRYADILSNPSCGQLTKFIKSPLVIESAEKFSSVVPEPSPNSNPQPSFGQKSLWLLQTTADTGAYNISFRIQFKGALDYVKFRQVLDKVLQLHQPLRTIFSHQQDEITVVTDRQSAIDLVVKDLTSEPSAAREEMACGDATIICSATRFNMSKGPLIKFVLYKIDTENHFLYVVVNHIVFDGYSINVFCNDLFRFYAGKYTGDVHEPAIRYSDFAAWQYKMFSEKKNDQSKDFWIKELDKAVFNLEFPSERVRPAGQSFRGSYKKTSIDGQSMSRLLALNKQQGVTSFLSLLTIFKVLLYRFTNQTDLLIGCPVANRLSPAFENLVGFFTNIIVLRSKIKSGDSFAQLLKKTKDTYINSLEHQGFPFEKLLEVIAPARTSGRSPLFQVMFAYHSKLNSTRIEDNLFAEIAEYPSPGSKFDLCMDIFEKEHGLEVTLTYDEALYQSTNIDSFLKHFQYLLNEITTDCNKNLSEYQLQPVRETFDWVTYTNKTSLQYDTGKTIPELFELQACSHPEDFAIAWKEQHLTYAGLKNSIDNRAYDLMINGITKNMFVGVCVQHDADMVITLMAIMKLGAVYVPLDPYYPPERLKYIIADSGITKVIMSRATENQLDIQPEAIIIPGDISPVSSFTVETASPNIKDLAYVMYTSGSTGQPKGVLVPHEGVSNYVQWMRYFFGFGQGNKVLSKTSINFDISVWELFLPLISGAELVLGDREALQIPESLNRIITKYGVTDIQFVPSALKAFVDSGLLPSCQTLKRIFSGGEKLPLKLQEDVFSCFNGELHNLYGPTEASIYVCHWQCRPGTNLRMVPIGKAIPNTTVLILDNSLNPVPPGIIGEIYICGVAVTNGYWRQKEATVKKFLGHPFGTDTNQKLFRTGDIGRYLADGNIEYLGRFDQQVKVRGYRIELGEIEHRLNNHPEVKHAVVIVNQYENDDVRLVAYLQYKDNTGPTDGELRTYLKAMLPAHMIPSDFVWLESIPLMPNNKIDYKSLPPPQFIKKINSELEKTYKNEKEKIISAIWEQILQKQDFTNDDNFFEVGGHSLLVLQLKNLIKEKLKLEISAIDIFQYPTIKSMASFLSEHATLDKKISEQSRRNILRKKIFTKQK